MPGPGWACESGSSRDRALLRLLQGRALSYFLDNQSSSGLIADRQANRGPGRESGLCSIAASGMGLIAIALSSAEPYRLIGRTEAIARVGLALRSALGHIPHDRGILPHFLDERSNRPWGDDRFSTVDSSWFLAGALWASAYLDDPALVDLAGQIYKRVDWVHWSTPRDSTRPGLIRHGKGRGGRFLPWVWDRANGETVMMYVLGAGGEGVRALPASSWSSTRPFYGEAGGRRFNNADLGLFVFQYGLDLLDLRRWRSPCGLDLASEAAVASAANREVCRSLAGDFRTYRDHWGLSAGDGPGSSSQLDTYDNYSPGGPIDGTAHLTATLASVAHQPGEVLDNVRATDGRRPSPLGRYGLSSVNRDRGWTARDMVGIDAGAVVLALDNVLMEDRVRAVFHGLPIVRRGLDRLGFVDAAAVRRAS